MVDDSQILARVLRPAGRSVLNWTMNFKSRKTPTYGCKPFGSNSHLVTICKIGLALHRQVPSYTLSCGAAMVLAQSTLFVHHSDSPILTLWRRECSPNERDAEPIDLQQPNVELFLIQVGGPSQSQQLHRTLIAT